MDMPADSDAFVCPRCGTATTKTQLSESNYTCRRCFLEVAYLDCAPNGTVRGVIAWLQPVGTVMHERYRITGILGRGGFGAAYLVQDTLLNNKSRALKEIPAGQYDEHETELLSRLHHPAVPDITDRFEVGGMKYLVIEFGGNRTLETERRNCGGTIPIPKLLPWMQQLCEVLSYLHGKDPPIVHRDLKPENILLDERDKIMLIDFGIAKESQGFEQTRPLTRAASYGFSPPEQVMSTGTDQRADVYALGATMYVLLTGRVPIPAHQRVAGSELPSPVTLNPTIPPALDAAIMQALELNMNRRQQSIAEFREVLDPEKWVDKQPAFGRTVPIGHDTEPIAPPPPPPPPPPKPRMLIPIAAAGSLVVLIGAVWILSNRSEDHDRGGFPGGDTPVPTIARDVVVVDTEATRIAMLDELHRQQTAAAVAQAPTPVPPTQSIHIAEPLPPTESIHIAEPVPPTQPAVHEPPPTRIARPRSTKAPAVAAIPPTPKIEIIFKGTTRTD